ncbi:tripartite ATP-independent transporter DctM subunit [Peptoniphilus koenoeneniae]|uniref:Tripartite ATP-independent transporter DctM subunit n=1 Tax=Peptoniphilus koenoeneniae TaxID=507751 RepID=A0ABU0AWK9_9FIRM|nr:MULTISPECIES: TRAP transporter large permease [Peptoniphilus]ERT59711.1 TRAP transporter, DctM subunit [Peptoniphilus sp. BV3C26]MDQ0275649.1 tripartite ATP-independent transporter DctM subunit [Peptoniphilus koenoeneniae]
MNVWIMFIIFLILLFTRVPIAYSLGISAVIYLLLEGIPFNIVAEKMYAGMDSFTMVCIPSFILAGNLMNTGGITKRIVAFCNVFVGHIRGALAYINILASVLFAGISGTALADVASLGSMLIPAMKDEGYDADFSVAITASTSVVGPIIPPSVPMVIAGTLTNLSIAKLFVGGIMPGLIMGLGFIIPTYYMSKKRNYPKHERVPMKERVKIIKDVIWALLMPLILMVGILSGIFTPTEASIVTVLYAFVVGIFIYKEIKLKDIFPIFRDTVIAAGSVIILVGIANLFAWILTSERVPQTIASGILSITENPILVILIMNIVLLFTGMFMESIAAIIIMIPVLLPVATAIGMSPIHFSIMAILNLMIGLVTPPVGLCLTTAAQIGKISTGRAIKANAPFLVVLLVILALVSYVPAVTTFLPGLMK